MQSIDIESPQSPEARDDSSCFERTKNTQVPRNASEAFSRVSGEATGEKSLTSAMSNEPTSPAKSATAATAAAQAEAVSRPTNLDLSESASKPMRFKRVVKSLQAKRAEARLLSVPNIKYQKSADSQKSELRFEESSGGNFLRRFSKFSKLA